jgi:hypothetical protein
MQNTVVYIHGKGGNAREAAHYAPLFPDFDVIGLDYRATTPWEAGAEIRAAVERLREQSENILLIANSIGAFFSMHARLDALVRQAFFISPIVDMEAMIGGMMAAANVTEAQLERQGVIETAFGEPLSWEYLCYVREHPVRWTVPTHILYGQNDALTPIETVRAFAETHGASLTVLENGEHWFHTEEQMRFLDDWIRDRLS